MSNCLLGYRLKADIPQEGRHFAFVHQQTFPEAASSPPQSNRDDRRH